MQDRKPVGRPPATDSAETRRRILAAARTCFSRDGYDKTTNKDIASVAGISAGALYHYFPSKCALFVASYEETLEMVFGAFDKALEGSTSLAGKMKVLMDVAADMHAQDRSLAGFVAIAPMEVRRHEELRTELGHGATAVYRYFQQLVADSADDLRPGVDPETVANFLVAVATGFSQFGATTRATKAHRAAIENFKRLVDGELFVDLEGEGLDRKRAVGKRVARLASSSQSRV
jgi:AcrR family transcriptional regulator